VMFVADLVKPAAMLFAADAKSLVQN
jgi:hypothetical protein